MKRLGKIRILYLINHYIKRGLQAIGVYIQDRRWRRRLDAEMPLSEDAVRQLVKERFADIKAKQKGHLSILYVGIGEPTYNSMHIYPCLRLFGHVTVFQPGGHPGGYSEASWRRIRSEVNEELLDLVQGMPSQPDIVIGQMAGWLVDPMALSRLKVRGIPIINYSWDDTAGFYGRKIDGVWGGPGGLASVVDLNLTSSRKSCLKYQAEGGLALFWPEAANRDIHRPYDLPFEFDVSFVGGRYGYRPLLIEFLRKQGVDVATFGPGWEGGILTGEEMVKLYSQSRINLGFGGIGHMVKIQHLKGRDFEVPMSGGLYLTSDNPELEECYEIGKEIVCYRDKRECVEKIRYLLERPVEAEAIRRAGRERALRDHTWERRLEQIFRLFGLLD